SCAIPIEGKRRDRVLREIAPLFSQCSCNVLRKFAIFVFICLRSCRSVNFSIIRPPRLTSSPTLRKTGLEDLGAKLNEACARAIRAQIRREAQHADSMNLRPYHSRERD